MNKEYSIKTRDYTIYFTYEHFMMLEERERKILELRFGLNDNGKHTFKEVGKMIAFVKYKEMIMSPERVRYYQQKALIELLNSLSYIKCIWNSGKVTYGKGEEK